MTIKWNEEILIHKIRIDEVYSFLTGNSFSYVDGGNRAICVFHDDIKPSLLLNDENHQYPNTLHCFACNQHFSVIDIIMNINNCNQFEARQFLEKNYGLKNNLTNNLVSEKYNQNLRFSIKTLLSADSEIVDIYEYKNSSHEIVDYNVRFKTKEKNKNFAFFYYCEEQKKYLSKQNSKFLLERGGGCYRFEKLIEIRNNDKKFIFVVEGEKDVKTLEQLFSKYRNEIIDALKIKEQEFPIVISLKRMIRNSKNFDITKFENSIFLNCIRNSKIFFISDTGKTGIHHMHDVFEILQNYVENFYHCAFSIFKYSDMSDNKDITDYLNVDSFHNKKFIMLKTQKEKEILNLLINMNSLFDLKKSKKFASLNEKGKPINTLKNIVSFMDYFNFHKKLDLSNREISYFKGYEKLKKEEFIFYIRSDLSDDGLKVSQRDVEDVLCKHYVQYHSFVEMMKNSKNTNYSFENLFKELFSRLEFNFDVNVFLMEKIFFKFIMTVISMMHNGLENNYILDQEIIPIFYGGQGIGKTSFFKDLFFYNVKNDSNNYDIENGWYNTALSIGNSSQNEYRDSILNNKKGVLVEFPEVILKLMMRDPNLLKAYSSSLAPITKKYVSDSENYISNTTMVFTTNNKRIINDIESRRFPVFDLKFIKQIRDISQSKNGSFGVYNFPIKEFWSVAYYYWLENGKHKLASCDFEMQKAITFHNKKYTIENESNNELSVFLNEMFDFSNFNLERKNYLTKVILSKFVYAYSCYVCDLPIYKFSYNDKFSQQIDSFIQEKNIDYSSKRINGKKSRYAFSFPNFSYDGIFALNKIRNSYKNFFDEIEIEILDKRIFECDFFQKRLLYSDVNLSEEIVY
jgi:hypothetical protein